MPSLAYARRYVPSRLSVRFLSTFLACLRFIFHRYRRGLLPPELASVILATTLRTRHLIPCALSPAANSSAFSRMDDRYGAHSPLVAKNDRAPFSGEQMIA